MEVTLKINGQPIVADTDKMHKSWIEHLLAYGCRRFPNDKFSGEKGNTKFELVRGLVAEMMSGEEMPATVRGSGTSAAHDPVTTLALKNAKADLVAIFRKVTECTKAIDFAAHEKFAPFFTVKDDRATWVDSRVIEWIKNRHEVTGKDYMGEARVVVEQATESLDDLGM